MTTVSTRPQLRRRSRRWSRERAMLLLGLPLVFAALVLSLGVIEYRPSDDDPAAREQAIRRARALAAMHQPEIQPRYMLSPPEEPQAGPEQDIVLFDR